jgi:hypothetical protein
VANTPWYTSSTLVAAVKRKIMFPTSQSTLDDDEILDFANEEMQVSQVPDILQYHEEYLVTYEILPLVANQSRYAIPSRAVGMRLRNAFWMDQQGNLFDMTRISPADKAIFQSMLGTSQALAKFYIEGNDLIVAPGVSQSPTGYLVLYFFLRPNQLVDESRSATNTGFQQTITVDNTTLVSGNVVSFSNSGDTFEAGVQFAIGATSVDTATNLVTAINTADFGATASNVSGTSAVITLTFTDVRVGIMLNRDLPLLFEQATSNITTTNTAAFAIPLTLAMTFTSLDTSIFPNLSYIDMLETGGGHRTKNYDVQIKNSSATALMFNIVDIPLNASTGDYVCPQRECIIPQIPSDLHVALAERVCARILSAIGDKDGLQNVNDKLQEINLRTGTLVDNRSEGNPLKVLNKNSLLGFGRRGRWF